MVQLIIDFLKKRIKIYMERNWSEIVDKILSIGQPLNDLGVHNWALAKGKCLLVLEQLLINEIPVLGGDVYENVKGVLQPNYDNWYCDKLNGESRKEFSMRSIARAKEYIKAYQLENSDNIFFVIVPDV